MIESSQLPDLLYGANRVNTLEQLRVLDKLTELVDHKGIWHHNAVNRTFLAKQLGIAEITLKITLRELLKKKYLTRERRGFYSLQAGLRRLESFRFIAGIDPIHKEGESPLTHVFKQGTITEYLTPQD